MADDMDEVGRRDFVNLCVSHLGVGSYLELGTTSAINCADFAALAIPICGLCFSNGHFDELKLVPNAVIAPLTSLPFHSGSFDFVVSEALPKDLSPDRLRQLFAETRRVARQGALLIYDDSPGLTRAALENFAFECGFRRHAGFLDIIPYDKLQNESGKIVLFLENVPDIVSQQWPLDVLRRERELHMDMSRESGSRSDAHLIRYKKAADLVRIGDVVLDAACGLGYGSWILASSAARRVVAVDRSEWAINYANFAFHTSKLEFQVGELPTYLDKFTSEQFDLIVSFETLEHLADPAKFLESCKRIPAPSGRIIVSVPHDWTDDEGRDPNPHHFDVYTWAKLQSLVQDRFILESASAQTADRAKIEGRWTTQDRRWTAFDPHQKDLSIPAEWLVAVGMKHFRGTRLPTWSREWRAGGHPVTPAPVDYVHMLENPWLSRALLDRGSRLDNPWLLTRECEAILESDGPFDRAAALVVLCYQDLEHRNRTNTRRLIDEVVRWRGEAPRAVEPYAVRWHVSLNFVAAKLALKLASYHEAEIWFKECSSIDAGLFGPLLLTKTVEAYYRLGVLCAADGREKSAIEAWDNGLKQAERVSSMPTLDHFGADGTRLPFVFKEIGQICQWGQACADALEDSILYDTDFKKYRLGRLISSEISNTSSSPPDRFNCWSIVKLRNKNQWCERVNAEEFILHPNGVVLADQPSLYIDVARNIKTQFIVFSAEAYDQDLRNGGVILLVGPGECVDENLQCWHLPPRKLVIVKYTIEKPPENTYRMRIVVAPMPNALSADYLGVRLKWIGSG